MHPMSPEEMVAEKLDTKICGGCGEAVGWSDDMIGLPICEVCAVGEVQSLRKILQRLRGQK